MNNEKEFFDENYTFIPGHNDVLQENGDISIFVTGSILEEAYVAVDYLSKEGYGVNLINVPCIKPLDSDNILAMARKSQKCFVIEEHNILGGLGSALAEIFSTYGLGTSLCRLGLKDVFAAGYGTHAAVRKANGLDGFSLYQRIKEEL